MSGAEEHPIAPGEHLSRVAGQRGFRGYGPLWDHPANQGLRQRRVNPHILAVGDQVHVPELELREVDRGTEQRHRFKVDLRPLSLRVQFQRWDRAPRSGVPATVLLDGKSAPAQALAPAGLAVVVEALTDRCRIGFPTEELLLRLGFLQPADTVAGYRERLTNLGYEAGDSDNPSDYQLRSAIEEFQCDEHLSVDGKVGPKTRAQLVLRHGC